MREVLVGAMNGHVARWRAGVTGLGLALLLAARAWGAAAQDGMPDPMRTGCLPPSPESEEWMRQNMVPTRTVRLNALGAQRILAAQMAAGKTPNELSTLAVVPLGQEVEGSPVGAAGPAGFGPGAGVTALAAPPPDGGVIPLDLPPSVDNSQLAAFPPITLTVAAAVAVATPCCPAPVSAMSRRLPIRSASSDWPIVLLILWAPVWFRSSRLR